MTIRPANLLDADWLIALAKSKYPGLDEKRTRAWFGALAWKRLMGDRDVLFLRGDKAALIAELQTPFYDPKDKSVHLVFLHANEGGAWEGYRMMELMVEWARSLGASAHFAEQCGIDIAPIAKRLGAVEDCRSWTVEAASEHQEGS